MATTKELSIADRLNKLSELQSIDSKLDKINVLRGELPMEVEDLEDHIEGLNKRISNLEEEMGEFDEEVKARKLGMKEAEALIAKYAKQQENVKNNREYDALTKEIELQKLEIELCNKKIKDCGKKKEASEALLEESKEVLTARQGDLETKRKELEDIMADTSKEEAALHKDAEKAREFVEPRLLKAYDRIRKAYRNGLAVVTVERDACGGCFAKIPPQRQMEIRDQTKFIVCEHCGRILVASVGEEEAA